MSIRRMTIEVRTAGLASEKPIGRKGGIRDEEKAMTDTSPPQHKQSWIASNLKGVLAFIVVIVVVFATIGLIYTQPWSKIEVIVDSEYRQLSIGINIYIDGELKIATEMAVGQTIVGAWKVRTGTHTVALDHGTWDAWISSTGMLLWWSGSYEPPNGTIDYSYDFAVGPLSTKNVHFNISLPPTHSTGQ